MKICSNTTLFFKTKFDEIKVNIYYTTLSILINGLNLRFKQETLDIINIIGNLLSMDIKIKNYDTELDRPSIYFHTSKEILISEITLLKQIKDTFPGFVYKWLNEVHVLNPIFSIIFSYV